MIVFPAFGWLIICLSMGLYGRITVADDIPYTNKMKAHKYLFPNKGTTFSPTAQLKFGNYSVQFFANGTLKMGAETLKFVGEDDVQIHEKSVRIVGNQLMIGNEALVPNNGKEIMLANGITMQPDGTLTSGPEQRGKGADPNICGLEPEICGGSFFEDCCHGYRCKGGICRQCKRRNSEGPPMKCYHDEDCSTCFAGTTCIRVDKKTRYCCQPPGYVCENNEDCCELICERIPSRRSRCKTIIPCTDRDDCTHDSECCNRHECRGGLCQCKLDQDCDDQGKGCCRAQRCDSAKGMCVCQDGADCTDEYDCCSTQNCINKKCKACVGVFAPCNNNDDCCSESHCHKNVCRLNFVKKIELRHYFHRDRTPVPRHCFMKDTNKSWGGSRFIYICPVYTTNAAEAAVSFKVTKNIGCPRNETEDYTKGSGQPCRYLDAEYDPRRLVKVREILLDNKAPENFDIYGSAGDINAGRGGSVLFLNWVKAYLNANTDFD